MSHGIVTRNLEITSLSCTMGAIARYWRQSYGLDYLSFMLLVVSYLLIVIFVEPFHRMFFVNNLNLLYPHTLVERVSVTRNIIYAGFVPLLILIIWLGAKRSSLHKCNVTILGFLISIALTVFITDSIKNAVGRPRPDLIARCKPAPGTPENVLVTIAVCTETDHHTLHDGWRSFPSGHSSFAFSGLGYLALFFAGQLHVFRPTTSLSNALLALSPLLCATIIAISRCEDYRHDVYDVTCGSIIGISIAHFSYRRYFPRLKSPRCDEPFKLHNASRNDRFAKVKNDEELARSGRYIGSSDDEEEI
ncbi:Diacylglycerol pyrophosphate phosphatase 1 [Golovinomyces cichoracearum]|uniref:Diacylglycerol pyrophosphate phosphatase 1 n=1 Tax=Golovinomyces cichoracearum TaxID=62708 RepID=A0A420HAM5_9PEZI|nr:Diacylglycerol pyrophosphate phosphatase 1 [Golovinomyces cichoracearum]